MTERASEDLSRVEWNFTAGPDLLDTTGNGLRLEPGSDSGPVEWVPDEDVGGALRFDHGRYLSIPAARVGPLDAGRRGDRVSVIALLRRRSPTTGFIAGMWQEDDNDPRRQYGLFVSLPVYGGDQRVCGHVSADGRPSEGLPYSRDYSASKRAVGLERWHVVAFSYDGAQVTSYLDGVSDDHVDYTEPGPPLGMGWRYRKNPYEYRSGLNRGAASDFTVGSVRLTSGMANHFTGDLARLRVTPAALSPAQLRFTSDRWLASTVRSSG
ncbi:LamG-like jellyroll fold domain-containing protein [Occultella aeris]|uniref:Concanavalin A-like lectin/glucanase superfamily protein n=1 Tax=Occultella aeris TaxID=2761496 RepID=A0A7M4DLJ9_9MICO|nr:LamG-like jellyroll fold domain-containing protein [Occultella aeris]VZO38160.1 hypothetical protein HALOF300_03016 [Occultella aeris]